MPVVAAPEVVVAAEVLSNRKRIRQKKKYRYGTGKKNVTVTLTVGTKMM